MIFPVIQQIKAALITTLKGVKKAAGYQMDFSVRQPSFGPHDPADPTLYDADVIVSFDGFSNSDETPIQLTDRDVRFLVSATLRAPNDNVYDINDLALIAAADVERAVMQDVTLSNQCENLDVTDAVPIQYLDDGSFGVEITIVCRARYQIGLPANPN